MASQFSIADDAPKARKARPSIAERAAERICPNCGKPSPERRSKFGPPPLYCHATPERDCKREMNNRNITDGSALIPYIKAWRLGRGSGEIASGAFARICKIADDLNEDDRRHNRPRSDYYAAVLLKSNAAPVDELRYGRRKIAQENAKSPESADGVPMAQQAMEPENRADAPPAPDFEAILRQIADGHNDPRALASAFLAARA